MIPARPSRFAVTATTTASAVLLAAAAAHPVTTARDPSMQAPATQPAAVQAAAQAPAVPATGPQVPAAPARGVRAHPGAAPADRSLSELLTALKRLYRKAENASAAYRRAARELRDQQKLTDTLQARLAQTRARLAVERKEAARIARAQYRTGAPGLPPTVRVLLADDPMAALHHTHALRRAAARQQTTVRALASGERHRGAIAAEARAALQRQQELADRKKRKRQAARDALREVERLLTSLTPDQLAALRRYEAAGGPGGTGRLSPP